MVTRLFIAAVDLLLRGVERAVTAIVALMWDGTGVKDLYYVVIEFLAGLLAALARYLAAVRERLKYRYVYESVTARLKSRYRELGSR